MIFGGCNDYYYFLTLLKNRGTLFLTVSGGHVITPKTRCTDDEGLDISPERILQFSIGKVGCFSFPMHIIPNPQLQHISPHAGLKKIKIGLVSTAPGATVFVGVGPEAARPVGPSPHSDLPPHMCPLFW